MPGLEKEGGLVIAGREKFIFARVTEDEWKHIHSKMEQAKMKSISAYVRRMAMIGYVVRLDLSDLQEILRLLAINSNNLNQYAKRANENGAIYYQDIKKLQVQQKEIWQAMRDLLDKLSKL